MAPHLIQRLRSDGSAHRQTLALFGVATLLMTFEVVFFFRIIVPQVLGSLQSMFGDLRRDLGASNQLDKAPEAKAALRAVLGVVHEREQEHVRFTNRQALINGCMLIGLGFLCSVATVFASKEIRRGPKKHVVIDILFTLGLLMLFQILFCPGGAGRRREIGPPASTSSASAGGTRRRRSTRPTCPTRTTRTAPFCARWSATTPNCWRRARTRPCRCRTRRARCWWI